MLVLTVMKPTILVAVASVLVAGLGVGCGHSQQTNQGWSQPPASRQTAGVTERQPAGTSCPVPVPPGSTLSGTTSVSEIRAFPEESKSGTVEAAVGVAGADSVYEAGKSYADTVSFYDQSLKSSCFGIDKRTPGQTSTIWSVHTPSGVPARIAVRNTHPPTVEIVEVAGAAAESK
jgi:hypothetical protein